MNIKEYVIKAMTTADEARPRSLQTAIGPSDIGGCRAQLWLRRNGAAPSNTTSKWAAIMGTAIHSHIETALRAQDPFTEKFWIEYEVEHEGIRGHIDLYIPETKTVVDWKTTTKKSLAYFPTEKQRWQVHLYGWLMNANGHEVETVALVAVARDGSEDDITVHAEPYDPQMAQDALAWLRDVLSRTEQPAPEKDAVSWCARFCEFYGGACSGLQPKAKGDDFTPITDDEVANAAKQYLSLGDAIKYLEDQQKAYRELLEGAAGITPDKVTVAWQEIAGRSSIDEDAVQAALGYVPKKVGKPTMRLTVKQA